MEEKKKEEKKGFLDSIKTKLVLTMLMIVAVPVATITIISTVSSKNTSARETERINKAQAHILEYSVKNVVDANMRVLQAIAAAPSTVAFLKGTAEADAEAKLVAALQQTDEKMGDGNVTAVTGSDGMQVAKSAGELVDVKDREYFQKAIGGTVFLSDINVSKSNGQRLTTFAVPVTDESGAVIGVVQRNYNLSVFHEMLASEVTEDRQELVMVDRTGSVIAHSSHEIDPENPEDQSMNPFYTDSRGDKTSGTYDTVWQGEKWMVSWYKEENSGWVVASCSVTAVAMKSANQAAIINILIGVAFLVGFGILAFFLANSFTAPIGEIGSSLEALADGRFVRIEKFGKRKDEFGTIIRKTNSVIEKLKEIVATIKNSAMSVNDSSEAVSGMAEGITRTADDVSNAVQEIAEGATQQADEIQEAVENTGIISRNIQKVTENAEHVTKIADEMTENSKDSGEQLKRLKASSDEMSKAIEEITEKISATEAAVERISDKVESINSIASQTNLLALNAAIEAARAGETGKGFAVVAEEIGKLADESGASAAEIRTEMDLLLKESQSAVAMAKEVNAKTEQEQLKILNETVISIGKLIKGIEVSVDGIETITESAKKCEESKAGITDSMNGLSAISEENAAASEETAASMQQLGEIVNSLTADASSLKEISNNLIQDMAFFKD